MKKLFYILLLLVSVNLFSQNQIIDDEDIPKLNVIIKSLEKEYRNSKTPILKSLPQTVGNYFEIVTEKPEEFISFLQKANTFKELKDKFTALQVDEELLVIKTEYIDSENKNIIEIKSFEIGRNSDHSISDDYRKLQRLYFDLESQKVRVYYSAYKASTWSEHNGATIISGFYLNRPFEEIDIPNVYADWVYYTDVMVKPETSIFYKNEERKDNSIEYSQTIIDSLINYYEIKTNKPINQEEKDYDIYKKEIEFWESERNRFSDSLYNKDKHFKELLLKSLSYAEKNKVSNGDLEYFTARLISKKRALNLMRQHREVGSCSLDDSPLIQQKKIAKLAVQTQNWNVFIKSFLNVMNDFVSRNANSNIATNARKTYIEELAKLDIDINKILLGSNFRIEDTIRTHYFSDGAKVAKAYANLPDKYQKYFEKNINKILKSKEIDAFNKLHFYNTYKYYQYFLRDTIKQKEVRIAIKEIIPFLPFEIKSRIENSNKQLYHLLHREREELNKYKIKFSIIANIYSSNYSGDCWQVHLVEKGSDGRLIYALTMPLGRKITPLRNFVNQKDKLKSRVLNHSFLQKIINSTKEKIAYLEFVKDKSFANYKNRETEDVPKELMEKLDFTDAISLSIPFNRGRHVQFILLNNNSLMILGNIPKGFELPGYKFEELVTKEEKGFFSTDYLSFKLFDEQGKMLN